MSELIRMPNSRFLEVECPKCGQKQVVFNKAAMVVKCLNCGEILARPTGGKAKVAGKVVKVLG